MQRTKIIYALLLIMFACVSKEAKSQSKPFEDLLVALKTDSIDLFKNSFSSRVHAEQDEPLNWDERLIVSKERFIPKYGLNPKDFTFDFIEAQSKLVIQHKTQDTFRIGVVLENGEWKLDEH